MLIILRITGTAKLSLCVISVLSMLPSLREALTEVLDTDQLTSQLKNR